MEQKKKYYLYLDILRLFSCVAVFLYHLNILKGGYLAVCSFFVVSAFLSVFSESKRENFSLRKYYVSRFLKLYIPLAVVVFATVSFLSLFPDILLPSLKPEVKSILLGYNNFWQLSANMDYFAQHLDSPFMHLWYVAILVQFDLVFPLIYVPLKKLGDKFHRSIPCIITFILSIACGIYFYVASLNQNIMVSYYNTFSRLFSLAFGLCLGCIHHYYSPLVLNKFKEKEFGIPVFIVYMAALIALFITIDASSKYFQICMIVTSLITCRIIDYSITLSGECTSVISKIIKYLSSISYEFYLLQYPIIFYLQCTNLSSNMQMAILVPVLVLLSCLLHYAISKPKKWPAIKYILRIALLAISAYGIYIFAITKDNTQEMNELKAQLAQNESLLAEKQDEYNKNFQEKQLEFEKALQEIDADEGKLAEMVTSIPVVAMGDSVMENNAKILYEKFPNMYIDAQYMRLADYAVGALQKLKDEDKLANIIILEFGANGDCSESVKRQIMSICEGKQVFWLTVPNDRIVKVNDNLFRLADEYENLHIIDWYTITRPHPEYFISDKVHLTSTGKTAFAQVLYDSLYDYYASEVAAKKEALQREHDEELNKKMCFFGNDLLLNAYSKLETNYPDAKYVSNKDFTFSTLKDTLQKEKNEKTLPHKIVLLFDSSMELSGSEWDELLNICTDNEIYIVSISKESTELLNEKISEKIRLIDFSIEISENQNYLSYDKKHLSADGISALVNKLDSSLKT